MSLVNSKFKARLKNVSRKPAHVTLFFSVGQNKSVDREALVFVELTKKHGLEGKTIVIEVDGSESNIDEIRDIKRITRHKNSEGLNTIVVINRIDELSVEAQNTMLKMLEEPVEGVRYVLSTPNIDKVLKTIQSRSQLIAVPAPSEEDFKGAYMDRSEQEISLAMSLAKGQSDKAVDYLEGNSEVLDLAKKLIAHTKFERLAESDRLSKNRELAIEVVEYLQNIYLHMLEGKLKRGDMRAAESLIRTLNMAEMCMKSLGNNGNVKLALDSLFIHM